MKTVQELRIGEKVWAKHGCDIKPDTAERIEVKWRNHTTTQGLLLR